MHAAILRYGILLALATLGTSAATAQTELFFATGVDSIGWAQAQSNADGHVLIESPQYPRGLWLYLVDEAGDALAGLQVEYQGRPDSLVAIRCVDPAGEVQETLIWTQSDGTPLRLTLKPSESTDLSVGLVSIDWQIDPSVKSLLELEKEIRLIGWEAVAAFLRERGQGQAGRVTVQIKSSTTLTTWAVEVDHPEAIETLLVHLRQTHRPAGTSLEERTDLYVQVFRGGFAKEEGVILYLPLFADANLEREVQEMLGRSQGRLTPEEVTSLTQLLASSKDVHDLAGIEHLTALQWLELSDNQIVDITPLKQLNNLQRLELAGNQIVDITPLKQLDKLHWLFLFSNQIVDVTPLKQLNNLQRLSLFSNQIVDVTPLKQLNNLQALFLSKNQIVDISPLKQLNNLQALQLADNQIVDITPLKQLDKLHWLFLDGNQIVDITPLKQLNNLQRLQLGKNQIVDITPLKQLNNLQALSLHNNRIEDLTPLIANISLGRGDEVNLDGNPLSDQALTEQIPALKARGVTIYYWSVTTHPSLFNERTPP